MRITSSMYYKNLFGNSNTKINEELFDVNKQISSGLSIQYASDNVRTFTETMRLDNEMTTLSQIKKSTQSGAKFSEQTDTVLSEFESNTNRMRTLLIQAANDTQDELSRDAIAKELRGIEKNLKLLANTSINGQFLFAGSAVSKKPINEDGTYNGNDAALEALIGSNNKQQFNVSGGELFLGEELSITKKVSTNVVNQNLMDKGTITTSSTIRELMGDKDNNSATQNTSYFYLSGKGSDGSSIHKKIVLNDTQTVENLLDEIGKAYGNTTSFDVVNVSLNDYGEIVVEDKQRGSSKLDFHLVGAVDFDTTTDENGDGKNDDADVDSIELLDVGESDYEKIKNGTATSNLFVKEFVKSDLQAAPGGATNIDALLYDKTNFTKNGTLLSANASQIVKNDNSFAIASTKLSEVADLSQGSVGTLDGTVLNLVGIDINGNSYTAQINLKSSANGGSTFSVDTDNDGVVDTDYNIYDMNTPRAKVDADEMTYRQLMDVMNMVVTDTLPASSPGSANDYDTAIETSNTKGSLNLSYDGKIEFKDLTSNDTQASIGLYDANSGDFSAGSSSTVMTFNTNSALSIRDPKTDFFKTIDKIIKSVENYTHFPDASSGDVDSVGIENAIEMLDDLKYHISQVHSKVGAQSNALTTSLERTKLMELSTSSLRSSVIDTDIAEASLKLQQLTLNYQAMLSTVGKVSKLSLVNYL